MSVLGYDQPGATPTVRLQLECCDSASLLSAPACRYAYASDTFIAAKVLGPDAATHIPCRMKLFWAR